MFSGWAGFGHDGAPAWPLGLDHRKGFLSAVTASEGAWQEPRSADVVQCTRGALIRKSLADAVDLVVRLAIWERQHLGLEIG